MITVWQFQKWVKTRVPRPCYASRDYLSDFDLADDVQTAFLALPVERWSWIDWTARHIMIFNVELANALIARTDQFFMDVVAPEMTTALDGLDDKLIGDALISPSEYQVLYAAATQQWTLACRDRWVQFKNDLWPTFEAALHEAIR
jgi:hypothetical protein